MLQEVVHLRDGQSGRALQVGHDGWVEVATTGPHHQTLERGEAHRRVDAVSTLDRGGAGTVAQMQDDHVQVGQPASQQISRSAGDEAVRDAVKAVPPDVVRDGQLAIYGIGGGGAGEIGVEGGVEDRDVWHPRQRPAGCLDPGDAGWVVQRRQRDQVTQGPNHVVIDHGRLGESDAAVDDPVSHGPQHRTIVVQLGEHAVQRDRMVGRPAGLADLFDQPALALATGRVDRAVLDRRRAAVDNEDQEILLCGRMRTRSSYRGTTAHQPSSLVMRAARTWAGVSSPCTT